MATYKVLLLDDIRICLPPEYNDRVSLEVTDERSLGNPDSYNYSKMVGNIVKRATDNGEYDLVVIGNNLGIGFAKATDVALEMYNKTIVVWNRLQPGDEVHYAGLGLEHFCTRMDLPRMIVKLLGVTD